MIKHLFAIMAVALCATASAQVAIERDTLGSGTPGLKGFEEATPVLENDIFHAPQYMANFPTAGTIWPRVVDVSCVRVGTSVLATVNRNGDVVARTTEPKLKCEGYEWTPKMGRGEYLFFRPHITEPVAPVTEYRERIILKEVAPKKARE